jgi:hypothetical protein
LRQLFLHLWFVGDAGLGDKKLIKDKYILTPLLVSTVDMAEDISDDYYLELSPTPVRFESVSKVTNVFFDDCNKQASEMLMSY